jgi:hypothetical protein
MYSFYAFIAPKLTCLFVALERAAAIVRLLKQDTGQKKKKELKVARRGLYSTAALYIADCALAPNVVPSFISRGATTPSGAGALY